MLRSKYALSHSEDRADRRQTSGTKPNSSGRQSRRTLRQIDHPDIPMAECCAVRFASPPCPSELHRSDTAGIDHRTRGDLRASTACARSQRAQRRPPDPSAHASCVSYGSRPLSVPRRSSAHSRRGRGRPGLASESPQRQRPRDCPQLRLSRPGGWNRGVAPRMGEAEACTGRKRSSTCVRPNNGILGRSGWDTSLAAPGLPLATHIDSRPFEYRDEQPYRRPQTARENRDDRVKRVISAPDDDGLAGRIHRRARGQEVFGVALPVEPALSCCTVWIRIPAGRLRRGPRHTHLRPFT